MSKVGAALEFYSTVLHDLMYFLLFVVFFIPAGTRICNISEPIGFWLEKNKGPCHEINGHFILDATANNLTKKIISAFSNVTRIEGCIKIDGFKGMKNVSFFSNLKDVICDEDKAYEANLTNVIDVHGEKFERMGFNSLQNVTGPGEIRIYFLLFDNFGFFESPCFSREELIFLAYHPQFHGEMYLPCKEIDDRCFRLDKYTQMETDVVTGHIPTYSYADIPPHCTTFFGSVSILGAVDEQQLLGIFDNLTLIIGQLHIGGTLLDRLDRIFPKLQVSYPYYFNSDSITLREGPPYALINTIMPQTKWGRYVGDWGINQDNFGYSPIYFKGVQFVHARINRFLTNWSIPTLLNIRPLDVGDAEYANTLCIDYFSSTDRGGRSSLDTYLTDTADDPCIYFPQFNGSCVQSTSDFSAALITKCSKKKDEPILDDCVPFPFNYETWFLSMIAVVIGLLFSFRAIVLLAFSKANKSLSFLCLFLILVVVIQAMVALENTLMYQKGIRFFGSMIHFLPQFESLLLFHPASQWIMTNLASSKHSCLAIIVLCYMNVAMFSVIRSRCLSLCFCLLTLFCFPILTAYLNKQIHLEIRGIKPRYSKQPRQLLFIPFIMNVNFLELSYNFNQIEKKMEIFETTISFVEKFNKLMPETAMLLYNSDDTLLSPTMKYEDKGGITNYLPADFSIRVVDIPFEIFGQLLPDYSRICDIAMAIAAALFFVMNRAIKLTHCHGLSQLLILLYLQLSINRIRFFIHDINVVNDFCNLKDYQLWANGIGHVQRSALDAYISCYDGGQDINYGYFYYPNGTIDRRSYPYPSMMTRYEWGIIERFFEMLPYTFYLFVSYFCYKFARFHHYLGAVMLKEEKKKTEREKETTTIFTLNGQQVN